MCNKTSFLIIFEPFIFLSEAEEYPGENFWRSLPPHCFNFWRVATLYFQIHSDPGEPPPTSADIVTHLSPFICQWSFFKKPLAEKHFFVVCPTSVVFIHLCVSRRYYQHYHVIQILSYIFCGYVITKMCCWPGLHHFVINSKPRSIDLPMIITNSDAWWHCTELLPFQLFQSVIHLLNT